MSSPPKRPRLSLQTSASAPTPSLLVKSSTAALAQIDTTSPTAFNTLSNAYATAIEQSSTPATAILITQKTGPLPLNTLRPSLKGSLRLITPSSLKLVTTTSTNPPTKISSLNTRTKTPAEPNRPLSAFPDTPTPYQELTPITAHPDHANVLIGTTPFTYTPPQSAHPAEDSKTTPAFTFKIHRPSPNAHSPSSPRTPRSALRRRFSAPYSHPRSLHSILRNSPLPPRSSLTPLSPSSSSSSRISKRLVDRTGTAGSKKLAFNNPLTQTITTQTYTRSHIDLLVEEASPFTPTDPELAALGDGAATTAGGEMQTPGGGGVVQMLDLAMAYTGDETRDGGQTPGPFEEMRRRMAGLGADSSDGESVSGSGGRSRSGNGGNSSGNGKKRKRREKKRQWIWTIGRNEEDEDDDAVMGGMGPGGGMGGGIGGMGGGIGGMGGGIGGMGGIGGGIGARSMDIDGEDIPTARPGGFTKTPITAIRRGETPGLSSEGEGEGESESCTDGEMTDGESVGSFEGRPGSSYSV